MKYKSEYLDKLVSFVDELIKEPENETFKKNLSLKLYGNSEIKKSDPIITEIYEYCINLILREQAENFYKDFMLLDIKERLINDFVRMEKFRRENNFEDFCLAAFQQIEGITNCLVSESLQEQILLNRDIEAYKVKDKETGQYKTYKLWQLIFYPDLSFIELEKKINKPILEWEFGEKLKVILYKYYFNNRIYNYFDFTSVFYLGNDLYQSRNLNHRGGKQTEFQAKTIEKVKSNYNKYYFKFLGFLEDFTSKVNNNLMIE